MMSKEKRRVPKLRFPGFTEDWEQRKLGDLIFLNGRIGFRGYTEADIVSKDEGGVLTFSPTNIVDNQITIKCKNTYITRLKYDESPEIKIYNGDILFVKTGSTLGKSALVKDIFEDATLNPQVVVMRPNNLDSEFLSVMILTDNIASQVRKSRIGGAVPTLTESNIKAFDTLIPKNDEEAQKIGKIFGNLDHVITLHQRKLNNIKLKKKALLQKLFPKNGERYPELRFPGFTDAWEQRKLSDISTKVTTKNVDVHYTETLTNSAEQGIISQVDFFDKEISNKDNINGYYIVDNNDFIYNPRISTLAPVGPINRNKLNRTGIMSPLYTIFRASNVDLGFLEWYFQSSHWHRYMKLNGDSGARADRIAIKDSTFFEMPIKTPVNIKEQVLIGETLEKFNQYITLHQRKLEHLQLQKKALLQQMFV